MLDYRSDTFHTTRNEIQALKNDLESRNIPVTKQAIEELLNSKKISFQEFSNANTDFLNASKLANKRYESDIKAGKSVNIEDYRVDKPEGFGFGRVIAGAVGEVGRDIKGMASAIAPETTEAVSKKISDVLPDTFEKRVGSFFDPYMGEGVGADVSRISSDIASFFVPVGFTIKGLTYGSKFLNIGKGLGPKSRRLRRMGRAGKYGFGGALGTTIAEDAADENMVNVLIDGAELVGMEKSSVANLLNKIAVNPDDTEAQQKLNSFLNNLALAGTGFTAVTLAKKIIEGGSKAKGVSSLDYNTAQIVNKIVKRNKANQNKKLIEDSTPVDKVKGIKNKWFKGFRSDRGTDAFTLERILFRENNAKKATEEIDGLTKFLMKTVDNEARLTELSKKEIDDLIQVFLETGDEQALRMLKQEAPETAKITQRMFDNVTTMRSSIAKYTDHEDLKAIYDPKKKKVYLNRTYRIHDDPSFSRDIKDVKDHVRKDVEDYLRKQGIAEEDLVPAIKELLEVGPDNIDKNLLDVLIGKDSLKRTGKAGYGLGSSKTYLPRKMDELPEIRALWGEVKDPYINYKNTYAKLSNIESELSFVNDMSEYLQSIGAAVPKNVLKSAGVAMKDWEDATDLGVDIQSKVLGRGATSPRDVTVPIMKGKKPVLDEKGRPTFKTFRDAAPPKQLNPLEGLYVNKAYKNFIEQGTDILGPQSALMKNWMRYKIATQTSKTVYNPATHGRNTMGNMIMLVANGMNPFRTGPESFEAAFKKLTGYTDEGIGKRLGRYQELGITDSGVRQETLKRTAGQVFNFDSKTVLGKASKAMDSRKNPLKTAQNLYQIEDDFFKVMHFEKTLKDLKKVFPKGTSIDVIEKEAARRTRNLMPNYGLVGKSLKELRYLPFGDFIAFPAEMTRISYHLGKTTLDDITGATARNIEAQTGKVISSKARKELKNMGYRRLAGMTTAGTAGEQAMMYSANRLGITPDQREAIETLGPSYAMGSPKIFLSNVQKDKNNHYGVNYINLGPIDPFNYVKAPALLVGGELIKLAQEFSNTGQIVPSENFDAKFKAAFTQALGPFLGTSMATDAIMNALSETQNPDLNPAERSLKIAGILTEQLIPGAITMAQKGQKYRVSKESRKDQGLGAVSDYDYTIPEIEMEALGGIPRWFGIRPQRLDITAGMRRQILPVVQTLEDKTNTYEFMNNPNSPRAGKERDDQFIQAYIKDQTKRLTNFQKLKRIADAYDHLGLDYKDLVMGLSKEGLKEFNSDKVISSLELASENYFTPSFIPENLIPYAQQYTGGDLPYDKIEEIMKLLTGSQIR